MTENANLILSDIITQDLECNACHRTYFMKKRDLMPLLVTLALLLSGIIMYGTKCQQEKRENAMYHNYFCNTTQFSIVPPATGLMTFHSSGQECQWVNIRYFDCQDDDALSQKTCSVEKTNQFNNMNWPCVVRFLDDQKVDCQTLPRWEKPDDNKILTCALGMSFMIVGGAWSFCFLLFLWMSTIVIRHE
jgi:hypothetical protein